MFSNSKDFAETMMIYQSVAADGAGITAFPCFEVFSAAGPATELEMIAEDESGNEYSYGVIRGEPTPG